MPLEIKSLLIVLSIFIAILGTWISLCLLNKDRETSEHFSFTAIFSSALAFATSVWSMHFINMLATYMMLPISYNITMVVAAYCVAFVGSLPLMWAISMERLTTLSILWVSAGITAMIGVMHYVGMLSIQVQLPVKYDVISYCTALILGFLITYIAVSLYSYWKKSEQKGRKFLVIAGGLIGVAEVVLHFAAMKSVIISQADISTISQPAGLAMQTLLYGIISASLLILLLLPFTLLQKQTISIWKVILVIVLAEATAMLMTPLFLPDNSPYYSKIMLNIVLLALFVSPVAWKLMETSKCLLQSYELVEKNLEIQKVNNQLLTVSLHEQDLTDFLGELLQSIYQLSWLKLLPKGAIFLKEENEESLFMAVQHHLETQIQSSCQHVKYGQCLCGKAAKLDKTIYCTHINDEHTTRFEGMGEHGHFIIPLKAENEFLGVLCLYLSPDTELSLFEQQALTQISATIAELIRLKQALDEINLANTVFDYSFDCLMITDANHKILNVNPKFSEVTGYASEEVIGQSPEILKSQHQDPGLYHEIKDILGKRNQWQGEVLNRRKNGEDYFQWLSIATVKDKNGGIKYYVSTFTDISEKKEVEKKIHRLAFYDELTGLANRRLFYETLKQAIQYTKRSGDKLALLFIDLDRFKEVNDTLGHQAGDQLLITVAQRIKECLRESDMLARLGGDEFVVILEDLKEGGFLSPAMVCQKIAEEILYKLSQAHYFDEHVIYGGASIGIVFYPDNAADFNQLLQRADTAMYQAKSAGRNTYCFFSEDMSVDIKNRVTMIHELKNALQNNEFSLLYQPQISMEHQQVVGAEALIRWHNPVFGQVSPLDFIPLVEEIGLIYEIGLWVMRQVCRQVKQWDDKSEMNLEYVALNVSIHQLIHPEFVDDAISICRMEGIDSQRIEMEITEGGLAKYPDNITEILHKLREAGFRLAIDDFGTDYSSLSRLKHFNVDLLKIDRSFVMNMTHDANDAAIAQAVVDLAKALGLLTLAEGVETIEQFDALKAMGCERCQGYYFGKPMLPESLVELFRQRNKSVTSDSIKQGESIED